MTDLQPLTAAERAAIERLNLPPSAGELERRIAEASKRLDSPFSGGKAALYSGPAVYIGFDAEWVTRPITSGGWTNDVLCVSAVLACEDRRTRHIHHVFGTARENRPTQRQVLQTIFRKALTEGTISAIPDKVTIFGHFIRGDLAAFEDFWARRPEFRGLGRTLVSGFAGHTFELEAVGADAR